MANYTTRDESVEQLCIRQTYKRISKNNLTGANIYFVSIWRPLREAALVSTFGGNIKSINSCRYLRIFFTSGRTFRWSFDDAESCLFIAFNSIYNEIGCLASEELAVSLFRMKCICLHCSINHSARPLLELSITSILTTISRTSLHIIVNKVSTLWKVLPIW